MHLHQAFFCADCFKTYDDIHKPCLGLCGDSICLPCAEKHEDCPICKQDRAFSNRQINYDLLRMVEEVSVENFTESAFMQLKEDFGKCMKCGEESKKLRICMDCTKEERIGDYLVFPAYFRTKHLSLCATCALDGEHSTHQIAPLTSLFAAGCKILDVIPLNTLLERVRPTNPSAALTFYVLFVSLSAEFFFGGMSRILYYLDNNKSTERLLTFEREESKELENQIGKTIKCLCFRIMANTERIVDLITKSQGIIGRLGSWWILRELRTIGTLLKEPDAEVSEEMDRRVNEEVFKYRDDLNQNLLVNTLKALEKLKKANNSLKVLVEIGESTPGEESNKSNMLAGVMTHCDALFDLLMCFVVFEELMIASYELSLDFEHGNYQDYFEKFKQHRKRKFPGADEKKIKFWLCE